MSFSVNRVMLLGMVGKDPEIRRFSNGGQVANFSVATEESWKDKNSGEWKKKTDWHNVAIFSENLCLIAEKYVKKGSKVYVEGKLVTRKWQGKDGFPMGGARGHRSGARCWCGPPVWALVMLPHPTSPRARSRGVSSGSGAITQDRTGRAGTCWTPVARRWRTSTAGPTGSRS